MMTVKSKKVVRNVLLGMLVASCGTAFAAEKDLASYSLDPMLVTASRYETREVEIPAATEVFTQEKIQQLGANTVMDVVRNIPGLVLNASPTGNTFVGFRGMKRYYVAILVNGIMLNQDGNYDLESISTDIIDRIEVVKGGSSVLYGSSASAGVINIITKKEAAKNRVLLAGGDQHKFKGSATIATDKLQVNYDHFQARDVGTTYKSSSRVYIGDKITRENVSAQYQFNDNLQLQYMHTAKETIYTRFQRGVPSVSTNDIQYNMGQLNYTNDDLLATLYYRDRDWKGSQKGHNIGLDVQNKWNLGKTMLTAGVAYDTEKTHVSLKKDARERDSGAVFFMTENQLSDKTTLMVGAREAYYEHSGSELCPQVQVKYALSDDDNLYVNVNKSMRAPTFDEIGEDGVDQVANPDLKPEIGWNYEFGWKKRLSDTELVKVDVFKMDIKDRIYSVAYDDDRTININVDKYRNTGVEASYENAMSGKFSYNLGLSYSNPELKEKRSGDKWQRAFYRVGANVGLGYYVGKTSSNLTLNYMGDRLGDAKHMVEVNMNVAHRFDEQNKVKLAVYNLLDRIDFRSADSDGIKGSVLAGRNWLLSYEYTF